MLIKSLCIIIPFIGLAFAKVKPQLEGCNRDSEIDSCIHETIQHLIPALSNGSRELNMQPLDPFVASEVYLQYTDGSQTPVGRLLARDIEVRGLKGIRVLAVRSTLNEKTNYDTPIKIQIDVLFPQLILGGSLKANGRPSVLPLVGRGLFNVTLNDVSTTWDITAQRIQNPKNKIDYMQIKHFQMAPKVKTAKFRFTDFFNGDGVLNVASEEFANQLWPVVYSEMLPFMQKSWDSIMTKLSNGLLERIPIDQLVIEP